MKLTAKQRVFVDAYLQCRNATQAAIEAGYSERSARQMGAQNMSLPVITSEIVARTSEAAMQADEVIARLADIARGTIADFIEIKPGLPGDFFVDLERAKRMGKMHLVKRIKYNSHGQPEIELYDSQAALVALGKLHSLFSDRIEVSDDLTDEERTDRIAALLETARVRRDKQVGGNG
jgi:phage terminase small subunit